MEQRVIQGSTEACLRHYESCLPKSDRALGEAKKPFVSFTQANPRSVGRWLKGERPPAGEFCLRVNYFLESLGYKVIELEKLIPETRDFGRLVAYGIINIDKAVSELGLPSRSYLFRVLRGDVKSSPTRFEKMRGLNREYRDVMTKKIAQIAVSKEIHPVDTPSPKPDGAPADRVLILQALANHILATIPLAERAVSDSFNAEDRRVLRNLTGENGIFRLSNLLHRLCGEKARELIATKPISHKP